MLRRIPELFLTAWMLVMIPAGGAFAEYTPEQIFFMSRDDGQGFSREKIDLGDPLFSFSTLIHEDMMIELDAGAGDVLVPVARIFEPDDRERFVIEIHRVIFSSFAEAQLAGVGFLHRLGYNRVIQDKASGNSAIAHLAGAVLDEESGDYTRMARVLSVSRGNEALFVHAAFDYDDYPRFGGAVARFFGGFEMDEPGAPLDALHVVEADGAGPFLVPLGWVFEETETEQTGRSDFQLRIEGQEYPNLFTTIRLASLEDGRKLGAGMIEDYVNQIETSQLAGFEGDAEMHTLVSESGEPFGYSYARLVRTVDGAPLSSEFYIQTNRAPDTVSITGLNTFDIRHGVDTLPEDIQDLIFLNYVEGASAYHAVRESLRHGVEHYEQELDIRALGH